MNKDKENSLSYNRLITIFILICLACIAAMTTISHVLIRKQDKELTGEICTLISEEMDNSIRFMTDTAENAANMISRLGEDDLSSLQKKLFGHAHEYRFLSAGLIGKDGKIYADQMAVEELEKWGLLSDLPESGKVTISDPYRSGASGKLVFTVFSGLSINGSPAGTLFLTYPLSEIQSMANTQTLSGETEVWLMDGATDSFIRCSGSENDIGSWGNFKLMKGRILSGGRYEEWEEALRDGQDRAVVNYTLDSVEYTQAFKSIEDMPGWNIIVRMPVHSLTPSLRMILIFTVIFVFIIIGAALVMTHLFRRKEEQEKAVLEHLSSSDPLTMILNRRVFDQQAKALIQNEPEERFTFMFLDIDYFKQINDRFGHEGGDVILVEFAGLLSEIFGNDGIVARYGGDEFVTLVRGRSSAEINEMINRLRTSVTGIQVNENETFNVQFSAGIAAYPDNASSFRELIKRADIALYRVKEQGRNAHLWY